jgi:hypothetical protein
VLPARRAGIDTIDIGINLALICLERRGQCNGCGIGPAAPKRGDVAVLIHALETRHDHDLALRKIRPDILVLDSVYPRLVVGAVGADMHLGAGEGTRAAAALLQRHAEQRNRNLLTGRQQHVQFTR